MGDTSIGLALLLVASVMNASFTLPMKFTRRWAWENTWLAWTLFALLVLPPVVTYLTVPSLGQVYSDAGSGLVLTVALFGLGWGVAQVFFGLAVDAIGIALTFSIVLGLSAAVGSIIPLVQLHRDKLFEPSGLAVLAGVALVIIGVAVCAVAGTQREKALQGGAASPRSSMTRGLILCVLCGLGASLVNFGLAYGGPIIAGAQRAGAAQLWANNAVWLPVMVAGSIPNLAYCVYLMRKNATGGRYGEAGTAGYWGLAFVMAALWFASTAIYGISTGKLGSLGAVLGWPLFMSLIVITASVLGIVTGEWKGAGSKPLRIQMAGVMFLVLAVFVLSAASRWV